jgi:hypothetical protein
MANKSLQVGSNPKRSINLFLECLGTCIPLIVTLVEAKEKKKMKKV